MISSWKKETLSTQITVTFLFQNKKDNFAAYDKLKKVQEEVGIDFNFHDLRHTFCSNLVQSGMDVSVVRMIMGHEHLSTTQKYTHLSNPYIEDSLSRYWNQSTLIGGSFDGK